MNWWQYCDALIIFFKILSRISDFGNPFHPLSWWNVCCACPILVQCVLELVVIFFAGYHLYCRVIEKMPAQGNRALYKAWASNQYSEFQLDAVGYSVKLISDCFSKMDILMEFFESSTIHGLSYISTSKVSSISMSLLQ